jgi:AcrR family transcriptional regulator
MPKAIAGAHDGILEAARRLLASEGYERLTMRAIAAGSGLATGTLYRYYRAKDEIVYALMQDDWRLTDGALEEIASRAAARRPLGRAETAALLEGFFASLHGFSSKYAGVWRLMALTPEEEKSPSVRAYRTEDYVGRLQTLMRSVIEAGAAETADAAKPDDLALKAAVLTRIFSIYALEKEGDFQAIDLICRKLLAP